MSLCGRAMRSAGRAAVLMGACLGAPGGQAWSAGDWEAATFNQAQQVGAESRPAGATPEAQTVIRIKPAASAQNAAPAEGPGATLPPAAESLRVQWTIGGAESVAQQPSNTELKSRPADSRKQEPAPAAAAERHSDLLDALKTIPAAKAPTPAAAAAVSVAPKHGEIALRARPVAIVKPKASPALRTVPEIAGLESADSPPQEPLSINAIASSQQAAAPAAPLGDYSLPPRQFATVDALQLADRLETARLALQPAGERRENERNDDDSLPPAPAPGEPAFQRDATEPPTGDVAAGAAAPGDAAAGEDTIAGAEQLGDEPVDNRLQFLRFDTVLLEPGEWQWDIGLVYAFEQNDFPVVIIDNVGNVIDVVEGRSRNRELFVPFGARYGLNRRTQLFAFMPIGWANSELSFTGGDDFDNDGGIGDITFGSTFLLNSNECGNVTFTLAGTAPTGGDPFDDDLAFSAASLGDGFWAVSGDMTCIRTYDPVVLFTTVGMRHYFEREHEDADILPGTEYRWSFGVGFAVSSKVTLSARFAAAYIEDTEVNGDRIEGTTQEPMSVRLAATVAQCNRWFEPFVEFGTNDDSNVTVFGAIYTY